MVTTERGGMGVGEREGMYVCIYMADLLIHQKLAQHCKAIILQLKKQNPVRKQRGHKEAEGR